MDRETSNLLRSLGLQVRSILPQLYPGSYHRTKWSDMQQLDDGTYRFFDEDFCGACGVAAYMLVLLARRKSVDLDLTGHANHFWCQHGPYVVDPTYSQYNHRIPVYVGLPTEYHIPRQDEIWSRDGKMCISGVYQGPGAKTLAKKFPTVQNPFGKYHTPVIQKWLRMMDAGKESQCDF